MGILEIALNGVIQTYSSKVANRNNWTIKEQIATESKFQRPLANKNTRIGLDHATE